MSLQLYLEIEDKQSFPGVLDVNAWMYVGKAGRKYVMGLDNSRQWETVIWCESRDPLSRYVT